jgi:hypothetical protein
MMGGGLIFANDLPSSKLHNLERVIPRSTPIPEENGRCRSPCFCFDQSKKRSPCLCFGQRENVVRVKAKNAQSFRNLSTYVHRGSEDLTAHEGSPCMGCRSLGSDALTFQLLCLLVLPGTARYSSGPDLSTSSWKSFRGMSVGVLYEPGWEPDNSIPDVEDPWRLSVRIVDTVQFILSSFPLLRM